MDLKRAEELSLELMNLHGLKEWKFEFDRSKRRFGVCKYKPKIIGLSSFLVEINTEERVKDTILHEIAHALTPGQGHGPKWKQKCIEIGAPPRRCYTSADAEIPEMRYVATCTNCGLIYKRQKPVKEGQRHSCKCQNYIPWNEKLLIVYIDTHIN